MVGTCHCPDTEQLRGFVAGNLSGEARRFLNEHLAGCPRCQHAAAGLAPSESPFPSFVSQTCDDRMLLSDLAPTRAEEDSHATAAPRFKETDSAGCGPEELPLDALQPGDRLGKYLILAVLGRGGMGIVFKARDTVLDRIVALKVLGPLLAGDVRARQRFIREGRSTAAVADRHVVTVYAVEGHDTAPYLVLEYVEGQTLQAVLDERGPLPVEEVVHLGAQIAQGLAAAHQKGLIHRDVKPSNILLETATGRVTITDFGLARPVDDPSLSRPGDVCGTPQYMAPEQVAGALLDHRADLFSLGSVLYRMVTGEDPFDAPHTVAVLHRVAFGQPRPIQEYGRPVPAWLIEVIASLHEKDPSLRCPSAADVKAVFEARRSLAPAVPSLPAPADAEKHVGPPSRFLLAVVLGLVFLLSFPAFWFLTSRANRPVPPGRSRPQPVAAANREAETPVPAANSAGVASLQRQPGAPEAKAPPVVVPEVRPASPPTPREAVRAARTQRVSRPRPEQHAETPKADPPLEKGVVVLRITDLVSLTAFREEGLAVRDRRTSRIFPLHPGGNYLPLGEYTWEQADSSPRIRVSPRTFLITPERSVILAFTHTPRRDPPPGAGPPPPPPFPPPPGHPPRPGRRP